MTIILSGTETEISAVTRQHLAVSALLARIDDATLPDDLLDLIELANAVRDAYRLPEPFPSDSWHGG